MIRMGNLVYRKYTGKKGEVTATNAFLNLAVVEAISATDAEIATEDKGIVMPMIQLVKAGETLDITGYVDGSVVVNSLPQKVLWVKNYIQKVLLLLQQNLLLYHTDASGET